MLIVQVVLSYWHVDLLYGIVDKLFLVLCTLISFSNSSMLTSLFFPNLFSGFAWSHYLVSIVSLNFNLYHSLTLALIYYLSSEQTISVTSTKTALPNRFAHMTSELRACIQDPSGYIHQSSCTLLISIHSLRSFNISESSMLLTNFISSLFWGYTWSLYLVSIGNLHFNPWHSPAIAYIQVQ